VRAAPPPAILPTTVEDVDDVDLGSRGFLRRLLEARLSGVGLAILLALLLCAATADLIAPYDPLKQDLYASFGPPSLAHLLGTDDLGRDVLSRIIHGSRISLQAGVVSVGIALCGGVALGLLAGYAGGLVDQVVMRFMDMILAFPTLVLALAITAALGPNLTNALIAIGIVSMPSFARLARAQTLGVREIEFVEAARALGEPELRVLARHVLPTVLPSVVVLASVDAARILLALSGLSFLGLGVPAPTAEWGMMLNEARPYLDRAPQLMLYPGLAIATTALALNLVGDGLRDALDPRAAP
jgi:ABC-type dipeptide/oligopeptide/nickel transport system permease subunit